MRGGENSNAATKLSGKTKNTPKEVNLVAKKPKPVVAWLTVNRSCNLRCSWCYAAATNYVAESAMSEHLCEKLIHIATQIGVKNFTILGGEPTLWKPLLNTIRSIRDAGARSTVVSNGIRFSDDRFWGNFIENPCDKVGLSVKAHDFDSFKTATGSGSFSKAQIGLSRVIDHYKCGVSLVYS